MRFTLKAIAITVAERPPNIWVNTQAEHLQTRQGERAFLVTAKKAQKPILVFVATLPPFGVVGFMIITQMRLVRLAKKN
jgi:hypothetical protein